MDMKTCSIPDCERPHEARGWCKPHWKRWRRTGDPGTAAPSKFSPQQRMEDPDYFNSHMRRIRDLGPASALPCTDCGNPARHWSYDHGDPEERSTPNPKTGSLLVYSMKNEHYVPRCATCHARHDR